MNRDVTGADWELCLRVLQASSRGEYRGPEDERWKTLLSSIHRRLLKEAKRTGQAWLRGKPALQEPSCIETLRLLAMSAENRQLAIESSDLRPVVRRLRREIRLDLRSEPQRSRPPDVSEAEHTRILEVLQVAKDSVEDVPKKLRAELARVIHDVWRQARRNSRRKRVTLRKLTPGDCRVCERELVALCDGLDADFDYRLFKGLLAKVERAFEKDIHQGRSSVEERRHHRAEDAGSSPAGPDRVRTFGPARMREKQPQPSLVERFFKWISSR